MLELGPQVAIVDNDKAEVAVVESSLQELHIGYQFFNADPAEADYPATPIESVELLFLDLYYTSGISDLDPYQPAQWVDRIIPDGKSYYLVIFSTDIHDAAKVIDVLHKMQKEPTYHVIQSKRAADLNIKTLLDKVEKKDHQITDVEEFHGEIIEVREHEVIINCLLNEKNQVYQIRRFDMAPLKNIRLATGVYLNIKITTKPGERIFEFSPEEKDLKHLFEQKDVFDKYKGSPLFKGKEK